MLVSAIVGCVGADQQWNILQSRLAKMESDMLWDDLRSSLAVGSSADHQRKVRVAQGAELASAAASLVDALCST
jgi:hypothetical protein